MLGEFSKLWKEYDSTRNLEELRGALLERSKEDVVDMLIEYEKETVEKQIELVLKEKNKFNQILIGYYLL